MEEKSFKSRTIESSLQIITVKARARRISRRSYAWAAKAFMDERKDGELFAA